MGDRVPQFYPLQTAKNLNTSGNYHKAPDIISIHPYTGTYPPEGNVSDSWGELREAYQKIYDMCYTRGFITNIAATEFGFGATFLSDPYTNDVPSDQANNTTQAIYYLRERIMSATIQPSIEEGMEYCYYFLHSRFTDDGLLSGNMLCDWGFFNFDGYPGSNRAIRFLSRELMNPINYINLGITSNYTWLPLQTNAIDNPNLKKYIAWCGFEREDGDQNRKDDLWLVVWIFKRNDDTSLLSNKK